MNIGSMTGKMPHEAAAELAAGMADRVRSAHREAEVESPSTDSQNATSAPTQRQSVDAVGGELRRELEDIIAVVVSDDASQPENLVDEVIDCVVADRMERADLSVGEDQRHEIVERMRTDPVVVGEVDALLCDIAREMALRQ